MFTHRLAHYFILLAATAILTLPNLGTHNLSDVDEGVNAEASREMLEADNWITPLFNFELRTAKPVLLYWLQMASYRSFGVNEFAARLPSALAAMLNVLIVYELARRMFDFRAGLLAAIALASCMEFCMLAHAATPDSTMLLFTVLTFYLFWIGSRNGGRAWFVPTGMAAGLAVMTKGPIGILLPEAVIFLYLLWNRELKRLLDWRVVWGFMAFLAVAAPWYAIVTLETRGAWIKQFIGTENVGRFLTPMEQHKGPIFYHLISVTVLFAPWSVFLVPTLWYGAKEARIQTLPDESSAGDPRRACRFLGCWALVYLVFFSLAATKLPNYVFGIYPALAILTGRFLERWRSGTLIVPQWVMPVSIVVFGGVGVFAILGLEVAAGAIPLSIYKFQIFPGLARWSWVGIIPIGGALAGWLFWKRRQPSRCLSAIGVSSIAFIAILAAYPIDALDEFTAPKQLVDQAGLRQPDRDIRLVSVLWFQPSLVFYSRREVEKIETWQQAADCLATPQPVYLLVPELIWHEMQRRHPGEFTYPIIARHWDFQKKCDVIVVSNQRSAEASE
jgi:4-amino-4-deoxy-L-arabinose transferase-like glycosyltransferase